MNELRAFEPFYIQTTAAGVAGTCATSVTVTAVDATAVPTATAFVGNTGLGPSPNAYRQIRVANKTNVWVHVNFGVQGAVVAASLNSQPFPPNSIEVVTVSPEVTGASVFANGAPVGSASVMFTRGQGTV